MLYFTIFYIIFSFSFAIIKSQSVLNPTVAQYQYPGTSRSERDLPICPDYAACSILHRRFWGAPPLIERLCRCAGRLECPSVWSNSYTLRGSRSMYLNTRAQLKFCNETTNLKKCRSNVNALIVTEKHSPPDTLTQTQANIVTTAILTCNCPAPPAPRHWQYKHSAKKDFHNGTVEITTTYACAKIPKCDIDEFCGNVRSDLFSSYYRCSCLVGTLCLYTGYDEPRNVTEVLFSGPAYRAQCKKFNRDEKNLKIKNNFY